jgi:ketosteroid isomerase-like protein
MDATLHVHRVVNASNGSWHASVYICADGSLERCRRAEIEKWKRVSDLEIQDIQIAGDWAFASGYGSYKIARGDKETVQYAKLMWVINRQSNGTWRFARVMGLPAHRHLLSC